MKNQIVNKESLEEKRGVKKVKDKNGEKKFKILILMNNLTHMEYKLMRRELPKLIGKCVNTLDNYSNIPMDSKEDIPYHVALIIEKYFCIPAGTLSNLAVQ